MDVLHGLWTGSALSIWGEDSELVTASGRKKGRQPAAASIQGHPFALSYNGIRGCLGARPGPFRARRAVEDEIALRLPSDSRGPLSSPELIVDGGTGLSDGMKLHLAAWRAPCLSFKGAESLAMLASLPDDLPHDTRLGASLGFWAEANKLALEILAHERFVPAVIEDRDGGLRAVWQPLLDTEGTHERLRLLSSAMPPVCRALDQGGEQPAPVEILCSFLAATVDQSVRGWLASNSPAARKRGPRARNLPLAQRWLSALFSPDGRIEAPPPEDASFAKNMRSWTAQLRTSGSAAAFRTCFRLEPPRVTEERDPSSRPDSWSVTFHLQATDDRSLLVDAPTVWKERSGVLTFLKRRFENPQERLLADLGRASRLFPALESSLRSPRPAACKLPVEQAYQFLRESAPLLEESGFGVLVPPWWQKPSARLGVRLKVKPKNEADTNGGLLGMNSLVDYDWEMSLGDEKLSREEFERLAALKVPLVQVRGQWVELRSQDIEAAIR
ncbi:MAG: SNF2 helicase-associated domain-containing protein, partial [Dehalococcoidia bacterium]|nr:SNF2 helicase-associated domain-containing protein [Dehalococcoidia bacterium]